MKVVLIRNREIQVVDIESDTIKYEEMQKYCNCEIIDCYGLGEYDIWLDDMGKLKDNWEEDINVVLCYKHQSGVYVGYETLVGDLMICSRDNDGNSLPLTDEQVQEVLDYFTNRTYRNVNGKTIEPYLVVNQEEE